MKKKKNEFDRKQIQVFFPWNWKAGRLSLKLNKKDNWSDSFFNSIYATMRTREDNMTETNYFGWSIYVLIDLNGMSNRLRLLYAWKV